MKGYFIFTILFPVLILLFFEAVLRIVDYGPDLSLFRVSDIGGKVYYNMNPSVKSRYFTRVRFNPMTSMDHFPIEKEDGTYRIFCLGASTTAGYPYGYIGSFSTFLQGRLSSIFPDRRIEVINLGLTATNSFTTLDFARELVPYEPDLLIVYDGHNEFYGALGLASNESAGQYRWVTRLYLQLVHSRVFLLARDLFVELMSAPGSGDSAETGTMMERLSRGQEVRYGSDLYHRTRDAFRENILELIDLCKENGIALMLSTQVSNLRNQPPFISRAAESISVEAQMQCDSLAGEAETLMAASDPQGAADLLARVVAIDSTGATPQFLLARNLDTLGRYREAERFYVRARDYDMLRFRMSSDFNHMLAQACAERGAIFVDMEQSFRAASPDSIIGHSLMLEHVHPNVAGYFLMGREYARAMKQSGLLATIGEWSRRDTISEDVHWEQRALTVLDERAALRRTAILTAGWPFRSSFESPPSPDPSDRIAVIIEQMLDGQIAWEQAHVAAAEHYEAIGEYRMAEKEYEALIKAIPVNVSPYLRLSRLLLKQLKYDEGFALLTRSLEVEETSFAYRALGAVAVDMGKPADAVRFLERAVDLSGNMSERTECTYLLALALGRAKMTERSAEQLRQVLRLDPSHRPAAALLKRLEAAAIEKQ
jgi:tetratricopeptide (TPR) repeat protein